ncbi:MAG: electron transfer flavoprotein subunit alpha/FixB family protein [Gemmatimonadota bacterium]
MADRILAIAEQREGRLRRVSNEVVSAARRIADALGGEVDALVLGPSGSADGVGSLGEYGADRVRVGEHDAFDRYSPDGFAAAITEVVGDGDYFAVLFPASAMGKDLAPRVAARLDLPLATEATGLAVEEGELVITRPMYAGKVFARVVLDGEPRLVSLRPNVFTPEPVGRDAEIEAIDVDADPDAWRVRVRELQAADGKELDVAEAPVVVSGGRGLQDPDNWTMLEELRDAIGGSRCALGASRAVVDAGWRPHAEQVGQTGKTVAPQLYFAIGISGAIQHLAGMRTAGTIVAINKDPEAPIFNVADYGIVGDAFDVLPRLTEAIRDATD